MEEHVFLKTEEIHISSTRLILGNKTIVMNAVCSIELDKEEIVTPWFFLGVTIFGLLLGFVSPFPLLNMMGWLLVIVGIIMSLIRWTRDRDEAIIIELNSGEREFVEKTEVEDLSTVFKALNEVILFRG
jgi:hypothetical protein